jgi:hypothetical protein
MDEPGKRVVALEKAIYIASNEMAGVLQTVPGSCILSNICILRVLDGAIAAFALLKAGLFSFVPIIIRTQIEAIAQYKAMQLDNKLADSIIIVNNKKRIKNMETAIRSGVLSKEHMNIAASMSKKAKKENQRKTVDCEMTISNLISGLNDDVLEGLYSLCSLHSHNDLNEMVSFYVEGEGDEIYARMPQQGRWSPIDTYAQNEVVLLFNLTLLYQKCNEIHPNERVLELGQLAAGN